MDTPDITTQILIQIRDELRDQKEQTNARFDKLIAELVETNRRIDDTNRRLDRTNRQLLSTENRLGTEISALRDEVRTEIGGLRDEVRDGFANDRTDLRNRVTQCERDIAELRQRG